MAEFKGSKDESAIVLSNVFPASDVVFSTPFQFKQTRSGVFAEGGLRQLEALFKYLFYLLNAYLDEDCFGRWIGLTPPQEESEKPVHVIIHYEAKKEFDKIQLLNLVLRRHLAEICNLCLATQSVLTVKVSGEVVYRNAINLPKDLKNGEIMLPILLDSKTENPWWQ